MVSKYTRNAIYHSPCVIGPILAELYVHSKRSTWDPLYFAFLPGAFKMPTGSHPSSTTEVNTSFGDDSKREKRSSSGSVPPPQPPVFEDFLHHAAIQRLEEEGWTEYGTPPTHNQENWLSRLSAHKGPNVNIDPGRTPSTLPMTEDEVERANASRSLRLASWAAIFYLITTDILGPFNAPFAISQVGWVPGKLTILGNLDIDAY